MGLAFAFGKTVVLQRKFDAEDWLRLVAKYRVTSTFSAPTPIRMVCNLPDEVKAPLRPAARCGIMIANAAPWSFALKQQYVRDFPPELAVGGLRLDRARREHDPRARRTSSGSPARAARPRRASRSCSSTTTARWSRSRTCPASSSCAAGACSTPTTRRRTSTRPTRAATTTPSATSPTSTRKASTTSATARRT